MCEPSCEQLVQEMHDLSKTSMPIIRMFSTADAFAAYLAAAPRPLEASGFFKPLFHKLPNDARLQAVQAEGALAALEREAVRGEPRGGAGKMRGAKMAVVATRHTPDGAERGQELTVFGGERQPGVLPLDSKKAEAQSSGLLRNSAGEQTRL